MSKPIEHYSHVPDPLGSAGYKFNELVAKGFRNVNAIEGMEISKMINLVWRVAYAKGTEANGLKHIYQFIGPSHKRTIEYSGEGDSCRQKHPEFFE